MPKAPSPKVRHVDFYPDEWLAGTATLDAVEIGVYVSVCAMIYSHGGPVNEGEVRRFVRCHGNAFNRAIRRLEMLGKIERNGSEIDQKRSRNELEKARKRSEKARQNIAKANKNNGIPPPDRSDPSDTTRAFLNHQPPTTNLDSPPTPPSRGGSRSRKNGKVPDSTVTEPDWHKRCQQWTSRGFWQPLWGPKPNEPGCWAPASVIAEACPNPKAAAE